MQRTYRPKDSVTSMVTPVSSDLSKPLVQPPVASVLHAPLDYIFDEDYYRKDYLKRSFSDLITHSRSGNATMVDSDGLLKWAPHNLLTYSEDFSDSDWTKNDSSIQSNVIISPDGTLTGDKIVENTNNTWHGVSQPSASLTSGTTYTATFFVKKAERSIVQILFSSSTHGLSAYANFDILNGVLGTVSGGTASITNIGNNWYRISYSSTATSTATGGALCAIVLSTTSARVQSYTGDGTSGIYLWGAHLYRSDLGGMVDNPDQPTGFESYVPTTSSAVYLPRRGHHVYNGSAWVNEGLLHESEARTNLVTYSEDFSQAYWVSVGATKASASIATPASSSGGYEFVEDASTGVHLVATAASISVTSGITYTGSVFLKKGDGSAAPDIAQLTFSTAGFGGSAYANFNLATGAVTAESGLLAKIEDYGGGWYRCSISQAASSTSANGQLTLFFVDNNASATRGPSYTGDINANIFVEGAQLEAAPTPSSYIPTVGATVTRAAETLTIPSANLPWPTPQVIGDELVTNGTFDTDTNWSKTSTVTISGGVANIVSDGSYQYLLQVGVLEVGKVYKVTYEITSSVSGSLKASTSFNISGAIESTVGSHSFVATAKLASFYIERNSACDISIDNVSVREINPLSVSIQMDGRLSYADEGSAGQVTYAKWEDDTNNRITLSLDTDSTATGEVNFTQVEGGTADTVTSSATEYAPGILVPFNIASRHGSTFINGAVDGVALTANTTPTALPNLSSTDLNLGYDMMGTIKTFRIWDKDLGDTGIEEASS